MTQDPWFQSLFADRIGGANYGKGTEIYKFEKIKRAKRAGPRRPPRAQAARLRHRRERRHGRPARPRGRSSARSTSSRTAATPTTASPPSRKPPPASCSGSSASTLDPDTEVNHCIGSKPAPAPCCRPCFINPGDVTLMTVPGYPVAGTHTQVLRRRGPQPAAAARRTASSPTSTASPPTSSKRAKLLVINYPEQPDRRGRHARLLQAGHRLRPHEPGRRRAGRRPHPADATTARR